MIDKDVDVCECEMRSELTMWETARESIKAVERIVPSYDSITVAGDFLIRISLALN